MNKWNKFKKIELEGWAANRSLWAFCILSIIFIVTLPSGLKWVFPAIVGNKPITRFELWKRMEETTGEQVLDDMVNERIYEIELKKKGVKLNEEEFQKKLEQIKKVVGNRINEDILKKQIRNQMLIETLLKDKIVIDNKEINEYFLANSKTIYKGKNIDQVRESIKESLLQRKTTEHFESWMNGLKAEYKVKRNQL